MNDIMRQEYRELSSAERDQIAEIKSLGQEFIEKLHEIGGTDFEKNERLASRGFSIAQTKVQEAVFWATYEISDVE